MLEKRVRLTKEIKASTAVRGGTPSQENNEPEKRVYERSLFGAGKIKQKRERCA